MNRNFDYIEHTNYTTRY